LLARVEAMESASLCVLMEGRLHLWNLNRDSSRHFMKSKRSIVPDRQLAAAVD
jgi:hypothetical protein